MKTLVIEAKEEIIDFSNRTIHRDEGLEALNGLLKEEWPVDDDFVITPETIDRYVEEFIRKHIFCDCETINPYIK